MKRIAHAIFLLVALVPLAGCIEEWQQNAEKTSDDTRNALSSKINVIEVRIESNTENSNDDNNTNGSSETEVDSIMIVARPASGSVDILVSDISYAIVCYVEDGTSETMLAQLITNSLENDQAFELNGSTFEHNGYFISSGVSFSFSIQLDQCAASVGDQLQLRITIEADGGGETVSEFTFNSVEVGKSVS